MPLVKRTEPGKQDGRKRILYVEDDDTNWVVAELALSDKCLLERAKNGREAFVRLRQSKYDAILMDIELAGSDLNGIEITKLLTGRFEGTVPQYAQNTTAVGTPIIFVTAYTSSYSKKDLLSFGGDEVIGKPVDFRALATAIVKLSLKKVRDVLDQR